MANSKISMTEGYRSYHKCKTIVFDSENPAKSIKMVGNKPIMDQTPVDLKFVVATFWIRRHQTNARDKDTFIHDVSETLTLEAGSG